ncbi:MAG: Zn-ribbon domain-containing OB-fold protein [Mycobacteriales bacterium]
MTSQVPLVDYLALGQPPHLVAQECTACGARFFDRRVACAACSGQTFRSAQVATAGEVTSFTIVAFGPPGVDVPYVAALVDCEGTTVRGNIVGVPADPDHVQLGMRVGLTTFSLGADSQGTEAIGFGFTPLGDTA